MAPGVGPSNGLGPLEPLLRFVQTAEVKGHLTEDVEQARVHEGLVGQIVGASRATLQEVERRKLRGRRVTGVAGLEQRHQEVGHAIRLGQRLLRAIPLPGRHAAP